MHLPSFNRNFDNKKYSILLAMTHRSDKKESSIEKSQSLITQTKFKCRSFFQKEKLVKNKANKLSLSIGSGRSTSRKMLEKEKKERDHSMKRDNSETTTAFFIRKGNHQRGQTQRLDIRQETSNGDCRSNPIMRLDQLKKHLFTKNHVETPTVNGLKQPGNYLLENSSRNKDETDKAKQPSIRDIKGDCLVKAFDIYAMFKAKGESIDLIKAENDIENTFIAKLKSLKRRDKGIKIISKSQNQSFLARTPNTVDLPSKFKVELVSEIHELNSPGKQTRPGYYRSYSKISRASKPSFSSKKSRQPSNSSKNAETSRLEKNEEKNERLLWDSILLCYSLRQNLKTVFDMFVNKTFDCKEVLYDLLKSLCDDQVEPNTVSEIIFTSNNELKSIADITEQSIMHYLIRGPLFGASPPPNSIGSLTSIGLPSGRRVPMKRKIFMKILDTSSIKSFHKTDLGDMFKYKRSQIKIPMYFQCVKFNQVLSDFISNKRLAEQVSVVDAVKKHVQAINTSHISTKTRACGNLFDHPLEQADILELPLISEIYKSIAEQQDIQLKIKFLQDFEDFKVNLNGNLFEQNKYLSKSMQRLAKSLVLRKEYRPDTTGLKGLFSSKYPGTVSTIQEIN